MFEYVAPGAGPAITIANGPYKINGLIDGIFLRHNAIDYMPAQSILRREGATRQNQLHRPRKACKDFHFLNAAASRKEPEGRFGQAQDRTFAADAAVAEEGKLQRGTEAYPPDCGDNGDLQLIKKPE